MPRVRTVLWPLTVLPALVLAAGCEKDNGRQEVSGTVTLGGKPLPDGIIMFIPVSAEQGTQVSVAISNGAYRVPRDKGLVPGKYKVAISSVDGKTPESGDAPPGPSGNFASKNRIPPEYNQDSKIEVEVKKGQPNTFNYEIP
jgi:hypothetical protein